MPVRPEILVAFASTCWMVTGIPALLVRKPAALVRARRAGTALGAAGSAAAVLAAGLSLGGASGAAWLSGTWPVPRGGILVAVDSLSAVFLFPVAVVGFLSSLYGQVYLPPEADPAKARRFDFFLGLLVGALLIVVTARHGLLFLGAWEIMALAAFFLVATDSEDVDVRRASWIYIAAAHVGALVLFALVSLLHRESDSWEWMGLPTRGGHAAIFLLALVGFGIKAGVFPFHFWLPGAHANAPSHASAMLSAVVLKTGIYGLLRIVSLLPDIAEWEALLVIALGVASALYGVSLAVVQGDMKRLLAYSSIENIGLIFMGIGLAMLGRTLGRPELVSLGLSAALLHVWNHALFKSLLFYGAGAVMHATGTRSMDRLGGLLRSMPVTTAAMMVGALAVTGLPPLNGFASEWLLYLGLADTIGAPTIDWVGAVGLPAMAVTGAFALAAVVKLVGIVFLGQARTASGARAHDPRPPMSAPLVVLAFGCISAALGAPALAQALGPAVSLWARSPTQSFVAPAGMWMVSLASLCLIVAVAGGWALLDGRVQRGRAPAAKPTPTWACGYADPTPRMQYTSRSFSQLLGGELQPRWMRVQLATERGGGLFPTHAHFATTSSDPVKERWYRTLVMRWAQGSLMLRRLQQGALHLYLLYILLTLIALLGWATLASWWGGT